MGPKLALKGRITECNIGAPSSATGYLWLALWCGTFSLCYAFNIHQLSIRLYSDGVSHTEVDQVGSYKLKKSLTTALSTFI